ncbi:MAG: gluconate permease [Planctomycetales bacterium]|nr:gluconate permease [Planctomycetales bacterium]
MDPYPIFVLCVGIATVVGMILLLKINAFIALISAAFVVSLLAPGPVETKISRVAEAFGASAGGIGIVIALAAVIGKCLMDSGAADRIVRSFVKLLGEERAPLALMSSGYVLSVPVFFDTVFYLLVPLARSLWQNKRKNYVLYTTAIVAGGAVTHSMVPPTPGPLAMANNLGIDLGVMIVAGASIGGCMSAVGLAVCWLLNRWYDIPMRPYSGAEEIKQLEESSLPPLSVALLPVVLPVILIASNTIARAIAGKEPGPNWESVLGVTGILGNPNFALLVSTAISLWMLAKYRGENLWQLSQGVETALMSGGVVILITAAGGAFGKMLASAGIESTIKQSLGEAATVTGLSVLLVSFGVAALMKFAQGSGTVSMVTTSGMFAAMGFTSESLGFHMVYLACAIGSGSLVGDWMNNSGFWVFSKMSVLTTEETLRTWSVLTACLGFVGLLVTMVASQVLPFV